MSLFVLRFGTFLFLESEWPPLFFWLFISWSFYFDLFYCLAFFSTFLFTTRFPSIPERKTHFATSFTLKLNKNKFYKKELYMRVNFVRRKKYAAFLLLSNFAVTRKNSKLKIAGRGKIYFLVFFCFCFVFYLQLRKILLSSALLADYLLVYAPLFLNL